MADPRPACPHGACDGAGRRPDGYLCATCHPGTGKAPEPAQCTICETAPGFCSAHQAPPEAERRRVEPCATCRPCVDPSCACGGCPHSDPACPAERRGRPRSMPGYHSEPCPECRNYTVLLSCMSCGWGAKINSSAIQAGHGFERHVIPSALCLSCFERVCKDSRLCEPAECGFLTPGLPDGSGDAGLDEEAAVMLLAWAGSMEHPSHDWMRTRVESVAARLRARVKR